MIGKKINQLATELAPDSTDLTIIGDPISGVSKKITLAQLGAIFSGAVSFYSNLAAFPAVGDINVIYCAKDTQKLYLWSGSAYTEVFPSQALLNTYQLRSEKGVSNGYASLDSGGKVPISQLPSSIMEYKGTWNAATNTPTLANGTGDTGDVYICNVAGTVNFGAGPLTFAVGDYVIYSGSIWQRSSGAVGTVTSVGASITGDSITISNSPISTSGTLAFAFAGNSTQYVNGAGSLTTFPSLTGFVPYTGATGQVNLGAYDLLVQTLTIGKGNSSLANNTALGYRTLFHITTGNYNTAVGYEAAHNTTTGQYNTALGQSALFTNTTGSQNTAVGLNALLLNTSGGSNVVVGLDALQHNTTGSSNTALGYNAGSHITGGSTPNTTASNSVYIGRDSKAKVDGGTNEIVIGYNAVGNGSNTATFGNTSTTANYFTGSINGGSFVKSGGTSSQFLKADGSVDSSTYVTTDTFQTISASKTFSVGFSLASAGGTNQLTSFVNTNSIHSGSAGTNVFGFNNSNNIYFGKGLSNGGVITYNNAAVRFYALKDADGTIAFTSDIPSLTGYVPYTGATASLNLGTNNITSQNNSLDGNGTTTGGFYGIKQYSSSNSGAQGYTSLYALAQNSLYIRYSQTNGTAKNVELSSALLGTTIRQFLFPDASGTFALTSDIPSLSGYVQGSGTTNYLPKFTGTSTIGDSIVQQTASGINVAFSNSGASNVFEFQNTSNTSSSNARLKIATGGTSAGNSILQFTDNTNNWYINPDSAASYSLKIGTSISDNKFVLTTSGNLGLGVTPSAWDAGFKAIQLNGGFSVMANLNTGYLFGNGYFDGDSKYYSNGFASRIDIGDGIKFRIAPSGTAGNAISFTQAMTLDASGRLGIGNTTMSSFNAAANQLVVGSGSGNNGITIAGGTTGLSSIYFADGTTGNEAFRGYIEYGHTADALSFGTAASTSLTIASTGAATFSSSVTAVTQGLNSSFNTGAFIAKSNGNTFRYTQMGYDNTGNYGWIQALEQGTAYTNLILNGAGGNVGIGTTSPGVSLDIVGSGIRVINSTSPLLYLNNTTVQWKTYLPSGSNNYAINDAVRDVLTLGYNGSASYFNGCNVGIGTTAPTVKLQINQSTSFDGIRILSSNATTQNTLALYHDDNKAVIETTYLGSGAFKNLCLNTQGGNVGIGTTSPGYKFTVGIDVETSTMQTYTNGTSGASQGGVIRSWTYSTENYTRYTDIVSIGNWDGTNGKSVMRFFTQDASTSPLERLRITSGGTLLVGRTSVSNNLAGEIWTNGTVYVATASNGGTGQGGTSIQGTNTDIGHANGAASGDFYTRFIYNNAVIGTITQSGTTGVAYNTSSDYRLKTDYKDFSGLDLVSKIKAYDYEWKSDKTRSYGVIAHELQSVINYAVTGVKDGEQMQGVDYSKIVPVLIKAIQELNDKIK